MKYTRPTLLLLFGLFSKNAQIVNSLNQDISPKYGLKLLTNSVKEAKPKT